MAGNFLAKTIGLAALGIASYDTLTATNRQTSRYMRQAKLERIDDTYMRTSSLSTESETQMKMHRWAKNWKLGGNRLLETKDGIVGGIGSFFEQFGSNISTFALGAVALFTGAKKGFLSRIKIPYVGKIAAGILAFQAGKFVLCDLFGLGKENPRRLDIMQ